MLLHCLHNTAIPFTLHLLPSTLLSFIPSPLITLFVTVEALSLFFPKTARGLHTFWISWHHYSTVMVNVLRGRSLSLTSV